MALNIDIKDDTLYQLGQEEGLQKGQEKGQEKAALNMLREGFPQEAVARLAELPLERVVQLKLELDASRK
jgi:predicted transposase YdaD